MSFVCPELVVEDVLDIDLLPDLVCCVGGGRVEARAVVGRKNSCLLDGPLAAPAFRALGAAPPAWAAPGAEPRSGLARGGYGEAPGLDTMPTLPHTFVSTAPTVDEFRPAAYLQAPHAAPTRGVQGANMGIYGYGRASSATSSQSSGGAMYQDFSGGPPPTPQHGRRRIQNVSLVRPAQMGAQHATQERPAAQRMPKPVAQGGVPAQATQWAEAARGSAGSLGHPELCTRPCLFYASGTCMNGSACEFCHLHHPDPPAKLDKRQQERLMALPRRTALHLALPLLRQKMLRTTGGQQCLATYSRLCEVSGVAPSAQSGRVPSGQRSIAQMLAAMNCRRLLIMLQRTLFRDCLEAQAAADDLVQQMLSAARFDEAAYAATGARGTMQ